MKEIGGYFELERYHGQDYYPDLFHLNLGRCAISHFLSQVGCRELFIPAYLCDSVTQAVRDSSILMRSFRIRPDFLPDPRDLPRGPLPEGSWILVVNYYGQLSDRQVETLKKTYGNVLFDYTHAFFQRPLNNCDTVYSVRKFFGVPDGAYLHTLRPISPPAETDRSHDRMTHILGRFEVDAGSFYQIMLDQAHAYPGSPAKRMSPLTRNLLRSFDYGDIAKRRLANYRRLDSHLWSINHLKEILRVPDIGPFCYPLYLPGAGNRIRSAMAQKKIFVPTYWKNVLEDQPKDSLEYQYAADILALPCDQRYGEEDMDFVAETVEELI